jgi:Putative stress-responsive transcriptional regulator
MEKRLYRNTNDKILCGVCSGIADYFNLDPSIVRLAWIIFSVMGGAGLAAYVVAAIVIPTN